MCIVYLDVSNPWISLVPQSNNLISFLTSEDVCVCVLCARQFLVSLPPLPKRCFFLLLIFVWRASLLLIIAALGCFIFTQTDSRRKTIQLTAAGHAGKAAQFLTALCCTPILLCSTSGWQNTTAYFQSVFDLRFVQIRFTICIFETPIDLVSLWLFADVPLKKAC